MGVGAIGPLAGRANTFVREQWGVPFLVVYPNGFNQAATLLMSIEIGDGPAVT
jgi:hypothetical protein